MNRDDTADETASQLDHIATDLKPGDAGGAGAGGDLGTGGSVEGIGSDPGGESQQTRREEDEEQAS